MSLFTDTYLNQLLENAEIDISQMAQCIFNRFSLAVTANTAEYTLPDGIKGILLITYKGIEVNPLTHEEIGYSNWIKPQALSVSGEPKFYIRVGYGFSKIKFHPMPDATIGADDTDLDTIAGINRRVIIYCYRIAQPTGTLRLPTYLRRNIIKYHAMAHAYAREGKTQNLTASTNFKTRFDKFLAIYKNVIETIPKAIQFGFGPPADKIYTKPPKPVLPSSGKWSI